ncbi:ATP-binding protein [Novosphingobium album (ex Liu et al. 2023)]|uniref:ATP-binding protein n=1 Tax=Novosphingobium album (ex Liu et al. 2023) TaxID=3031130 RepID=A0ABT5WQ28_9SPHN|nr:ATP-binding protein [Novosphingobium album (ex Liu et al. 2023)]MDE8652147.1 ATP-binding protein [Novosphingobium album (ex Liu et al. 2023)]
MSAMAAFLSQDHAFENPNTGLVPMISDRRREGSQSVGAIVLPKKETAMSLPATIHTAVSPEAIHRASRLFSGGSLDVINEILQNSRRAGATRVAVDIVAIEDRDWLFIRDDGCGIDDPAALLMLGFSGWGETIACSEDPAGMGIFSLAGRTVVIESFSRLAGKAWKVTIPAEAWDTGMPLALEPSELGWGTLISIAMPEDWKTGIRSAIVGAALHYPLPVTLNGVLQRREDFLKDALAVEEMMGCKIGIYKGDPHGLDGCRLNFHGLQVKHDLPRIREVGIHVFWSVRVDILDAPGLHLVLPARKEMVQNASLKALEAAVEEALYRTIAAQPDHRLSFADYQRAHGLDIAMPEARTGLARWRPETADDSHCRSSEIELREGAMLIVPCLEADIAQGFARAEHSPPLAAYSLVECQAEFQGYDWYDALPRVDRISFLITRDGVECRYEESAILPAGLTSGMADEIVVDLIIAGTCGDAAAETCHLIAIDALVCRNEGWDIDEAIILVSRDGGIDPDRLARMIYAALFCADDDSDCDSWETQSENFDREAQVAATQILLGEDAALLKAVRIAASSHVSWLLPKDRAVRIDLGQGTLSVEFLPDPETV